MQARVGDWLLVAGPADRRPTHRGEIIAVHSAGGEQPYTVRWLDNGREIIVFRARRPSW